MTINHPARLGAALGSLFLLLEVNLAPAQSTAFTYQGRLLSIGNPVNGSYDLRLFLYDAATNGSIIAGPVTNSVVVSNGLFTTAIDFGPGVFTGPDTWLHFGIRSNNVGNFTALSPLQQLTPIPNAFFADTSSNLSGLLPASQLSGTLQPAQLSGTYGGAVNFNNPGNSFSGNGAGLTNLRAWQLSGNSGTVPGTDFIGTADNHPVEFRANGQRILMLQPDNGTNRSPNFIAGSPLNVVAAGVVGATIGGGGASNYSGPASFNQALGTFNTIGGGVGNITGTSNLNAFQATVGGGAFNTASGISSSIAGGSQNVAYNNDAAIAGGFQNQANYRSAVGGGEHNQANGIWTTVAGGYYNSIDTNIYLSSIGGGWGNQIFGTTNNEDGIVIAGGIQNTVQVGSVAAFIGGGYQNMIQTNGNYSVIGGGLQNLIQGGFQGGTFDATIAGGQQNAIWSNAYNSFIGGGYLNVIAPGARMASIAGGYANYAFGNGAAIGGGGFDGTTVAGNSAVANVSTIGGGMGNNIASASTGAVIAGGVTNRMGIFSSSSVIGGGQSNFIDSFVTSSTIAGGLGNSISNGSYASAIAGGQFNTIQGNAPGSFISAGTGNTIGTFNDAIGGGQSNIIQTASQDSVIAGGYGNTIAAPFATITGGTQNTISTNGHHGVIGGGQYNFVNNAYATVPGGYVNSATGFGSMAAGMGANSYLQGSFVWNAFQNTASSFLPGRFHVFGTNGFSVDYDNQRPDGGGTRWVEIGPQFTNQTIGTWTGAYLSDSGIWQNASDRNRKTNFAPVDSRQVLDKVAALPIQTWRYTNETDTVQHLGPTAQDFKAAFGLGTDDKSIGTVDEEGVALAAIQGLNRRLQETVTNQAEENRRLREQNQALEQRLNDLAQRFDTLARDRAPDAH